MPIPTTLLKLSDPLRGPTGRLGVARAGVLSCALVAFAFLYFFCATQLVNQTNPNRQKSDQQNNIEHTRLALADMRPDVEEKGFTRSLWEWFPHYTDGVVNPLWPWFSARLQTDDRPTDHQIFVRGKWVNVILTGVFSLGCGLVLARTLSLLAAINGMLLVGFGALLPQAVFYQPEPLYFILFCLCWLACLHAIHANPVWNYALLGILTGLAYLAKTSIQPLMISFVLVTTYRFLQDAGCSILGRGRWRRPCSEWHWQRHVVGLFFFAVIFLLTAGPRLSYANERFGSPFHSYPSYWMWMDSFPDGVVFMREHGDRESLESLPPEERPSAGIYLSNHTPEQALSRLTDGFWWTASNLFDPPRAAKPVEDGGAGHPLWRTLLPDRGRYLAALLGIAAFLFLWHLFLRPPPENAAQRLAPETSIMALFVVGCVLFYALAYGWYVPIGKGDRFMLSIYAPLALTLLWGGESILRRIQLRGGRGLPYAWIIYQSAHLVILGFIAFRLMEVYRWPYFYQK